MLMGALSSSEHNTEDTACCGVEACERGSKGLLSGVQQKGGDSCRLERAKACDNCKASWASAGARRDRWSAAELGHAEHRLGTMRAKELHESVLTNWRGCAQRRFGTTREVVATEQGAEAAAANLGSGRKPAVGAHAPEPFWEHMLEEAAQELLGRQHALALLAGSGVAVGERDPLLILPAQPGGGDGGLEDVAGKILEGLLAGASRLAMHDPGLVGDHG